MAAHTQVLGKCSLYRFIHASDIHSCAFLRPSLALADILQKPKASCSAGKTCWRKPEMRASLSFSLGTAFKLRLHRWPSPALHRSQAAAASTPGLLSPQSSLRFWLRPAGWVSWLGLGPASSLQTCCASNWAVTVSGLLMNQTCFSTSYCFLVRPQLPPALALSSPSLAEQTALTVPWHCHTKPTTTLPYLKI